MSRPFKTRPVWRVIVMEAQGIPGHREQYEVEMARYPYNLTGKQDAKKYAEKIRGAFVCLGRERIYD